MRPLLLLLVAATAFAQGTVILENYSTLRTADGNGSMWQGQNDASAGSVTICTLGANVLNCVAQPQGAGPVPNGVGMWLITLDGPSTTNYNDAGSYLKAYLRSGTWTATNNRMWWQYSCDASISTGAPSSIGKGNVELGTYVRNRLDTIPAQSGQGQHYYHNPGYGNIFAGQVVYAQINNVPNHIVGAAGNMQPIQDPEWFLPTQGVGFQTHYFDGMTHFYWAGAYIVDSNHYYGTTCHLTGWQLGQVSNEPDAYFTDAQLTYSGTGYQVAWGQPKGVPTGIIYDMRYSASDMHVAGFLSGTNAGTITGQAGSPYQGVKFATPAMPVQPVIYVAARPRMAVAGVSKTNPVILSFWGEHGLTNGDSVAAAGFAGTGWTGLNGNTYAITSANRLYSRTADGSLINVVVGAASGACTPRCATLTTGSAHGLVAGQMVETLNGDDVDNNGQPNIILTTPTTTTMTWATSAPLGTYAKTTLLAWSLSALTVPVNATGFGTWTANSGTITSTSNTTGFAQLSNTIPGVTPPPPPVAPVITSASPLPSGAVGVPYVFSFAASPGTPPYTWTITSGTIPPGLALSTGGTITGTPTTAGGPTSITVKVTDANALTDSKAFNITIGAPAGFKFEGSIIITGKGVITIQ